MREHRLRLTGFDRGAAWTINQWARYCAAQSWPITDGDAVRGMLFMMIDGDEVFARGDLVGSKAPMVPCWYPRINSGGEK